MSGLHFGAKVPHFGLGAAFIGVPNRFWEFWNRFVWGLRPILGPNYGLWGHPDPIAGRNDPFWG